MKSIHDTIKPIQGNNRKDFEQVFQEIITDSEIAQFIKQEGLNQDMINRSLTKFLEYKTQREKFINQDETYLAKGYQPVLIMNEGYADVSYLETEELVAYRRMEAIKNRIQLINLPAHYRYISTEQLDFEDRNRLEVYKALEEFVEQVGRNNKGLYLYGAFGIGKTYLMAYLANRLSTTRHLSTTMLHYPTFVVDIKNAIKDGSVKERIDEIKKSQILVLDDIGAEQHSSWVRDDVLQVILQYRMQENLPTFFTSNFSFSELERHFSAGKKEDETWQAKRVMERIRYLAMEMHLKGVNRR